MSNKFEHLHQARETGRVSLVLLLHAPLAGAEQLRAPAGGPNPSHGRLGHVSIDRRAGGDKDGGKELDGTRDVSARRLEWERLAQPPLPPTVIEGMDAVSP